MKQLPKTIGYIEDAKQLIRSSGSVYANFIEAVEALSKKDFLHRIKICRKEAKESRSWILLIDAEDDLALMKNKLSQEALELTKIFGSIIENKK